MRTPIRRAGQGLLLALPLLLYACAPTPRTGTAAPAAELLAVTFGGPGFHAVELDGYGVAAGPHWPVAPRPPWTSPALPDEYRRGGVPVAYVRGSTPEVSVTAAVPDGWHGEHRVRGTGDGFGFTGTGTAGKGQLTALLTGVATLPDAIDLAEDVEIEWAVNREGGWVPLGRSRHTIYTLLAEPHGPLLHTPLHIAATRARGLTAPEAVTAAVWSEFSDREVRRARDGRRLRYYGTLPGTAPAQLRGLLISGGGQCVSWSYLLFAALGAQGIESTVTMVAPPQKGRIFVKDWAFADGRVFIDAGPNGIAETAPAGDDVAIIPIGGGRPHGRLFTAQPLPFAPPAGDDTTEYRVGPNGLVDTPIDTAVATPVIATGFGLDNQRAYQLEPETDRRAIRTGGDDILARHVNTWYVLTGPNGILETRRQPGMKPGFAIGSRWEPRMGAGATGINFEYAIPRLRSMPAAAGDDRAWAWWIDTGPDGVSQTPGAAPGRGVPGAIAIAAGADGRLDSRPAGDDRVLDLSPYLDLAPEGFDFVKNISMWPAPGVPGQGNPDPPPDYPNHMILQVGDEYYDPSYGTGPFASQLAWERASIDAVGIRIQEDEKNVERAGVIVIVGRRATGAEPLTKFIPTLPPD